MREGNTGSEIYANCESVVIRHAEPVSASSASFFGEKSLNDEHNSLDLLASDLQRLTSLPSVFESGKHLYNSILFQNYCLRVKVEGKFPKAVLDNVKT